MERREAVALLKELMACQLADFSWVSIVKKSDDDYRLEIKSTYCETLREYAANNNLAIEENNEKGYCTIYKLADKTPQ